MSVSSNISASAKYAAKLALYLSMSMLALSLVRWGIDLVFGDRHPFGWAFALKVSVTMGVIWAMVLSLWSFVSLTRAQPTLDILDEETPDSQLGKKALSGFVAMEYFWLILNRTFVVFIAPEGLYGWRTCGPVTNRNLNFFQPWQDLIDDPEFMRDLASMQKLSRLRGGFFIDRSAIASVEINERPKWGMGGIPESGRILLHLTSGKTREFILLGSIYPGTIRDNIVLAPPSGVTPLRQASLL
jgi:hypothetical protein